MNIYKITTDKEQFFATFNQAESAAHAFLQGIVNQQQSKDAGADQPPSEIVRAQARLRGEKLHVQYRLAGAIGYSKFDIPVDSASFCDAAVGVPQADSMAGTSTPYTVLDVARVSDHVFNLSIGSLLLYVLEVPPKAHDYDFGEYSIETEYVDNDEAEGWRLEDSEGNFAHEVSLRTFNVPSQLIDELRLIFAPDAASDKFPVISVLLAA